VFLAVPLVGLEAARAAAAGDALADGFRTPPQPARPTVYWDWLNGVVDHGQLTRDLEAMKAMGLGGALIFDVAARSRPECRVPAGPAFMGSESVKAMAHAIREAGRLGLDIGLVTSSSYNAGGPWIQPRHANMALYHSQTLIKGPARFARKLPFPPLPPDPPADYFDKAFFNFRPKVPKGADGLPLFYRDVAVVALPKPRPTPIGFVFLLAPPRPHTINRVVLHNALTADPAHTGKMHRFAKDFVVLASADGKAYREVLRGTLRPTTGPQAFRFPPTKASHVKLQVLSGHNARLRQIELGEFEVYATQGTNVVAKYRRDRSLTGARVLGCNSTSGRAGRWTPGNMHDGAFADPHGIWRSSAHQKGTVDDLRALVDLTDRVAKDGTLTWDVPPGEWVVLRFVCTNTGQHLIVPSPKSDGLMLDHLAPEPTEFHMRFIADKLLAELKRPTFDGTAMKYMYMCSYEPHSVVPWTPRFLDEFRKRRGYDPRSFLPVLLRWPAKPRELAERFRYDYNRVLADLLVEAHYAKAREVSNHYGAKLCAEAGGPGGPVEALRATGALDIMRGEFWIKTNVWVVKGIASAAHIYGHKIVEMEAFTTGRSWLDGPFEYKPVADRALCEGTTRFVIHTFPHNPPGVGSPGWVYYAGVHFSPKNTWWPKGKPLVDYLARCSHMLQQGLFVGDVCVYAGGHAPNKIPPRHLIPTLGFGYDYDMVNPEVLLTRMTARDGRLVLPDGMSYALLVLPNRSEIDLEGLTKLEALVKAGATIVGPKPTRSAGLRGYPARDAQVRALADKLWGPCDGKKVTQNAYGKGRVVWGIGLREWLEGLDVGPDFQFAARRADADLDFIHRRTPTADIYFVRNRKPRWEEADCTFRVTGKCPELWLPDTGEMRAQLVYEQVKGGTRMPLRLAPYGSVFVVFRKAAAAPHITHVVTRAQGDPAAVPAIEVLAGQANGLEVRAWQPGHYTLHAAGGGQAAVALDHAAESLPLDGPWEVRFPKGWGAPPTKTLAELISWTRVPDDGVKHFSGTATYVKAFDVPAAMLGPDTHLALDLGRVRFVADVRLNGTPLGILWKPPFRVDISKVAKPGTNRLEVEVTNVWRNRLIGDRLLPPGKRLCKTNGWVGSSKAPLVDSGLLGPVRLVAARRIVVKLPK